MFSRNTKAVGRALLIGIMSTVAIAHADNRSLIKNSPFIPEGWTPPSPVPKPTNSLYNRNLKEVKPKATLEYKGNYQIGDTYSFCIYDATAQRGTWVKINENNPDAPYVVQDFDEETQTLTLSIDGRVEKLKLMESDLQPMAIKATPKKPASVLSTTIKKGDALGATSDNKSRRRVIVRPRTNASVPGTASTKSTWSNSQKGAPTASKRSTQLRDLLKLGQ